VTEAKRTCTDFTCGNAVAGATYDKAKHCPLCWSALHRKQVAAVLKRPLHAVPNEPPSVPSAKPCAYRSELPLLTIQAGRMGLDPRRTWYECGHPDKPNPNTALGKYVCPCQSCNASCKGYSESTAEEQEADRRETNRWYQSAADEFARAMPPIGDTGTGRGITIAAGGKYWASAYVTIRMLRHVGCTLPVQVWYLGGSGERDTRYERLLDPFGVEFIDIDSHPARSSRRGVAGFQTKLFAVLNSPFEEVLSLDPDCYPCVDPTPLLDHPRYQQRGAIYWPDGEQTNAWTNWKKAGVKPRGPAGLETGMYVVHKRTAWEPLQLAQWYDDHPEWAYGGAGGAGGIDYGDKGPHRVAWAKLNRDYVMFATKPGYEPLMGFVQMGPDGVTPMFIHRCHSKWAAEGALKFPTTPQWGEPNARFGVPGEEAAFGFLEELKAALASM
jgi:hypothetical protein